MKIEKDLVVSLDFTMTDEKGEVLDSSKENGNLEYIQGMDNIVPGLENALAGKVVGDEFDVTISPAEGFGDFDESLVMDLPKEDFKDIEAELEVGMELEMENENDPEQFCIVTISEITDKNVKVDGNHPLSGLTLKFTGKVADVRKATEEEMEHGHAHSEGGCC